MGLLDEMKLVRKVKSVAQNVVDENKGSEPMWATVRAVDGTTGRPTVEVDGGELVECDSWANECFVGDRVMIEVRNHKVNQVNNATNKAVGKARLDILEDSIEAEISDLDEGLRTLITATVDGVLTAVSLAIQSTTQLWFAKSTSAKPGKPYSEITQDQNVYVEWTSAVPTYNASYPYYFYCYQYMLADGSFEWSDVVYDSTIKDAKSAADAAAAVAAAAAAAAEDAQDTADDAKETADWLSTMVRMYNQGVLVCKTSQSIGALVNANGSFDIVNVTWSGTTPSAQTSTGLYGRFASTGLYIYDGSGTEIAHLGYGAGANAGGSAENAPYYTLGKRKVAEYNYDSNSSYIVGALTKYNNTDYICTTAIPTHESWNPNHWSELIIGTYSTAEGKDNIARGAMSHAEGNLTAAIGVDSHAEGYRSRALGSNSHAEGQSTEASASSSHAEGYSTIASGQYSHAEGSGAKASGIASHAGGNGTIAGYDFQTVIGEYNNNKARNAFEIGNGSGSSNRTNAFAVDWDGNVKSAGTITDGSGNVLGTMPSHQHQASDINSGTLAAARIPDLGAGKITSGTFAAARIPELGAGKITSGTFDSARIPSLDASKIGSGSFAAARIPSLDASKIGSGTFGAARLPKLFKTLKPSAVTISNIASGSSGNTTISISPGSDYSPVAIAWIESGANAPIVDCRINSRTSVYVRVRNVSSSSISPDVRIGVLCVLTSLLDSNALY